MDFSSIYASVRTHTPYVVLHFLLAAVARVTALVNRENQDRTLVTDFRFVTTDSPLSFLLFFTFLSTVDRAIHTS